MKLFGVFSAESPDTAGEVLDVKNSDISSLKEGKGVVNTEHIAPKDAEKSEVPENFKGFQTVVGRVLNAKKIFSQEDCENKQELRAWNKIRKPLICGFVEIFDDPGHPNASSLAAIIRSYHNAGDDQTIGFSVEGSTLKREGRLLKETVIRDVAITVKPCNHAATSEVVEDTASGISKSQLNKRIAVDGLEPLYKSFDYSYCQVIESTPLSKLAEANRSLKKALEAGSGAMSPEAATQGSALQSESQLKKLAKMMGKKSINRDDLKKRFPNLKDQDLEKIETALKKYKLSKSIEEMESIYKKTFGKK